MCFFLGWSWGLVGLGVGGFVEGLVLVGGWVGECVIFRLVWGFFWGVLGLFFFFRFVVGVCGFLGYVVWLVVCLGFRVRCY